MCTTIIISVHVRVLKKCARRCPRMQMIAKTKCYRKRQGQGRTATAWSSRRIPSLWPSASQVATAHVIRHTSHVKRHTLHVTRYTSHVTRHTSHVTRHSPYISLNLVVALARLGQRIPEHSRAVAVAHLKPQTIKHHPSPITHHPSPITHHPSCAHLFLARLVNFNQIHQGQAATNASITHHTSHITNHTSHVTHHASRITHHASNMRRHNHHIAHL